MPEDSAIFNDISIELLKKGHALCFQASGSSMYPYIRSGDILRIEPAENYDPQYGDILLRVDDSGKALVHRVIKIRICKGKKEVLTKGDTSYRADGYISADRIYGKVVSIDRGCATINIDKRWPRGISRVYAKGLPLTRWIYLAWERLFMRKSHNGQRIEDRIVMLSLKKELSRYEEASLRESLGLNIDREYLLTRASKEALTCLLSAHLRKYADQMPETISAPLEKAYYANMLRNTRKYEEAKNILKSFSAEGVSAIPLKGIFLAEHVYKNIALRPMTDIDMLIKREDLRKAGDALTSIGYEPPACYQDFLKSRSTLPMNSLMFTMKNLGEAMPSFVHLHWHLINSTWPIEHLVNKMEMARVWAAAKPICIGEVEALGLSPEYLLIHLLQHGFHHSFDKLILVADVIAVLQEHEKMLDWDALLKEVYRFGLSSVVYQALLFVSEQGEIEIPELEYFKKYVNGRSGKIGIMRWGNDDRSYVQSYLTYLSTAGSILNSAQFIWKTIFPSRLVMAHNLGCKGSDVRLSSYCKRIIGRL